MEQTKKALEFTGIDKLWKVLSSSYSSSSNTGSKEVANKAAEVIVKEVLPASFQQGRIWFRVAGACGMVAVILGAYGAHALKYAEAEPERKLAFDTASRYHFMHSLALMGVPFLRRPHLTGALFLSGMTVFCGTCYYHALSGNTEFRRYTPTGGITLIIAWLSMVLLG